MSRTRYPHYFDDFHQKVHEFFTFYDFCVVTTLLVGERLEVVQFRVSTGWSSNIFDVVNPGPPLFRWFLPRNLHIPQFLALLVLFHLGTYRKWNCHVGWLTDAHFSPIFSPYLFKQGCHFLENRENREMSGNLSNPGKVREFQLKSGKFFQNDKLVYI